MFSVAINLTRMMSASQLLLSQTGGMPWISDVATLRFLGVQLHLEKQGARWQYLQRDWLSTLQKNEENIWMFPKMVGFPPKSSILIGFSIIFTIHFGVPLIFGNTHIFLARLQVSLFYLDTCRILHHFTCFFFSKMKVTRENSPVFCWISAARNKMLGPA